MIQTTPLRAIINSHEIDLRSLANVAGGDPTTFYRGANFNDTDLRGEDLRGFNLKAATFERVRVDRNTKVDEAYAAKVGLKRTVTLQLPLGDVLQTILRNSGIDTPRIRHDHYGDLIEEAIFGLTAPRYISDQNRLTVPFDRDAFRFLVRTTKMASPRRPSRQKDLSIQLASHLEVLQHAFGTGRDRVVADAFSAFYRAAASKKEPYISMRQASLTKRTAEAVLKLSEREKMNPQELCCALLIAYASATRNHLWGQNTPITDSPTVST